MQNQAWFENQLARIDRIQAEVHRQMDEQPKLYRYNPFLVVAGAVLAAIIARLPEILAAFGLHH